MRLVYGTTGICLAVVLFCIVLLFARRPRQPWWMSDFWIGNVHCILIISFCLIGIMMVVSALPMIQDGRIGKMEILVSLLVAIITALAITAMKIPARLKAYDLQSTAASIEKSPAGPAGNLETDSGKRSLAA